MMFTHPSVCKYLGCFHIVAIMNHAAMAICAQGFALIFFKSPAYVPASGMAELDGNSRLNFFRNRHFTFPRVCTSLHSH